ncbi:chalcone isomerase family protein [Massilia antarctica]|uniref:Chalcone isomerase family protein n=2 Tax=Massilia antarctica TaxID=2765360 RepID=A0AA48WIS7_9BURK|nr:chalcone isomerase family protein [Massilia antarctica]
MNSFTFKGLLAGIVLACAFGQGASAAEISGVKLDDTVKVAGKELKLNGYGMRQKFVAKVYVASLYLPEKSKSFAEILKMDGPRRVTIVLMRDLTSDEFGDAFMNGLSRNVDNVEKAKIIPQISKFGEMFALLQVLKKGDVLHMDWIPGTGTQCEFNGKKIGEVVPDLLFYNAILRIWMGDHPVDSSLKTALLSGK